MSQAGQASIRVSRNRRAEGCIAWLTIDNAARLNALNRPLMREMASAIEAIAADAETRAVVLTGAGERAFIGGADIDEMAALDAVSARDFILNVHRLCAALRALPMPVIARIRGYTLGAGVEIAASCDLRVAAEGSVFGMPEVRLGIPSVIEAALLPGLVGWGRAREMLLLGETFSAREAAAWGLVERVVPADALDAAVERWLAALLRTAPRAVRLQKRLLRAWEELPLGAAINAGVDAFAAAFETDEPRRTMTAFLAKRRGRR